MRSRGALVAIVAVMASCTVDCRRLRAGALSEEAVRARCWAHSVTAVSCATPAPAGLLPHPDDCELFYQCASASAAPICRQCPAHLHFNPRLLVCDYPADAGCRVHPTTAAPTSPTTTPTAETTTASETETYPTTTEPCTTWSTTTSATETWSTTASETETWPTTTETTTTWSTTTPPTETWSSTTTETTTTWSTTGETSTTSPPVSTSTPSPTSTSLPTNSTATTPTAAADTAGTPNFVLLRAAWPRARRAA